MRAGTDELQGALTLGEALLLRESRGFARGRTTTWEVGRTLMVLAL